jgi:hypothetical protein
MFAEKFFHLFCHLGLDVFHRADVHMSSPGPRSPNIVHRRCESMWIVSIGGSQLDVFDCLLVLDALFDEKNLADIGSFDDVLFCLFVFFFFFFCFKSALLEGLTRPMF